jgi:hypothetical protein
MTPLPAMLGEAKRDRRPKMDFILCLVKLDKTPLQCRQTITGTMTLAP